MTVNRMRFVVVTLLVPTVLGAQGPHPVVHPPAKPIEAAAHHGQEATAASSCGPLAHLSDRGAVFPETAGPGFASYVDPTVRREHAERVMIGCRSFIAPFASLDGTLGPIAVGDDTNIQDNVSITGTLVIIGDHVSIAHGATIIGPATIGAPKGKPAFVGFNSLIDGATVEPDAMVTHLVKVSPGIVIHAGTKVLPGKWVRTQQEADDESLGKVTKVTDADRAFMAGVLHVNGSFAAGYADLAHTSPSQLLGAGRDPGHSDFNHDADMPTFAGLADAHPELAFRVIGAVRMDDAIAALVGKTGRYVSIRADEGEHFHFGIVGRLQDRVTFHALEHSDLDIGNGDQFGYHVVVHGGSDAGSLPHEVTRLDDNVVVKDWSVVFRSKVGANVTIGTRSYIDGCHLVAGTVVPDRTIMINDKVVGVVEW
jgi:carbonic anhydrase/acetyltransferase-like protein (isoleucine patch superfamily)